MHSIANHSDCVTSQVNAAAGIMGAKQTSQLIPLCHNIPLDKVNVELTLDSAQQCVRIEAMAKTQAYTGLCCCKLSLIVREQTIMGRKIFIGMVIVAMMAQQLQLLQASPNISIFPSLTDAVDRAEGRNVHCGTAKTRCACVGVEMEAMVAASVAALTVYDMCKALDKSITIQNVQLETKTGGKSGDYHRQQDTNL